MEKDRIKCGECECEFTPRKFLDGSTNYKCPVCEQVQNETNESVKLERKQILLD